MCRNEPPTPEASATDATTHHPPTPLAASVLRSRGSCRHRPDDQEGRGDGPPTTRPALALGHVGRFLTFGGSTISPSFGGSIIDHRVVPAGSLD